MQIAQVYLNSELDHTQIMCLVKESQIMLTSCSGSKKVRACTQFTRVEERKIMPAHSLTVRSHRHAHMHACAHAHMYTRDLDQ